MGAILMVWLVRKKNIPREVATIIVGAWLANALERWGVFWRWRRDNWLRRNWPNDYAFGYHTFGPGY